MPITIISKPEVDQPFDHGNQLNDADLRQLVTNNSEPIFQPDYGATDHSIQFEPNSGVVMATETYYQDKNNEANNPNISTTISPISSFDNKLPLIENNTKTDPTNPETGLSSSIKSPEEPETVVGGSWKDFLLEPFVFLYFFGTFLSLTTTTNLYMERGCIVDLGYSAEECFNITKSNLTGTNLTSIKDNVQILASNMGLYANLINTLPAVAFGIFVGPWSDRYGRIPPVLLSVFGYMLQDAGLIFFSYFDTLSVYYALICAIPVGLTGGILTMLGSIYSLITEKSTPKKRTIKYAMVDGCLFIGMTLGQLASSQIYLYSGYVAVYGTEISVHVVAFSLMYFFIKDNRLNIMKADWKTKIRGFFSVERIKDSLNTCMKVRENHGRAQIWLNIVSMCCVLLCYTSLSSLLFLYCNKMYGWQMPHFVLVSNISSPISVTVLSLSVVFLSRKLKVKEIGLGLLGVVSLASQSLVRAFAFTPTLYYIALVVGCWGALPMLSIRSRLSKIIQKDEIGKVYAILAVFESLVPLPSGAIFSQIYNASIGFYPGLTFLCASTMLIIPTISFIWMLKLPPMPIYENMVNETPTEKNSTKPIPVA